MKPFEFVRVESATQAAELLAADPTASRVIAGGTDLMSEIKEGVVSPATLVSLTGLTELAQITAITNGVEIGALVTLSEIEADSEINSVYPVLAQAAAAVATPQIRNVGTLGGNLCQRPRCWYYRSPLFDCRKKGGTICFAINGNSKYHAILGGKDCYIVHPSDTALALMVYRAVVTIAGPTGTKTIPIGDLFVGPEQDMMAETVLQPGEIVTGVSLPKPPPNYRSAFLKIRERQAQDFALVSVAAAMETGEGRILDARIVLGGVAPVPLRAFAAEEALRGSSLRDVDSVAVAELAVQGARPLKDNHFKVPLTSTLVARAITALIE